MAEHAGIEQNIEETAGLTATVTGTRLGVAPCNGFLDGLRCAQRRASCLNFYLSYRREPAFAIRCAEASVNLVCER